MEGKKNEMEGKGGSATVGCILILILIGLPIGLGFLAARDSGSTFGATIGIVSFFLIGYGISCTNVY